MIMIGMAVYCAVLTVLLIAVGWTLAPLARRKSRLALVKNAA